MNNEVIIVGKPNVGKSCLFNALVGKNLAIVENLSGLTRDLRRKKIVFLEKKYVLIDSAGIVSSKEEFNKEIFSLTNKVLQRCQLIIFVVDGKKSLSFEDYAVNKIIKKVKAKKILVINKSEGKINEYIESDCFKLGFKDLNYVSAEHRQGISELKYLINSEINNTDEIESDNQDFDHSIAIVGKPNTGKSTLLNSLIGYPVSITGEIANLTRDPVESNLNLKKNKFRIFDTAGIKGNSKNLEKIEKISVYETKRKIRLSEVIILVLDIENYFEKFNLKLIKLIVEESRCLIIVINKIDTKNFFSEHYIKQKIYNFFPEIKNAPVYFVSSKKKIGLRKLMQGIIDILPTWKKRISTNKLNNWLTKITILNPPQMFKKREVKLKFITQTGIGPPKFILFSNYPQGIKESYKRFLINNLKKDFDFKNIIIKLIISKSKNPYE